MIDMKITYIGHAGLFIQTQDCNILCDPWKHENPAFFKSWYVFPDNTELDWDYFINETNFLYISHVHRDHFDTIFLKELCKKNKNIKIILPNYAYANLKEELEKIGFKNFIVGEGNYKNTKFITYVCETLDREREDSALLVNDGVTTLLNVNDSKILPEHKKDIFKRFDEIDIMACQVSGASYHPNCYKYDDWTLQEKCSLHRSRTFDRFMKAKSDLNVKKSVVIAGPPCFLDEGLQHLNFFGDNSSVFPDAWQIRQFDSEDSVYRVLPGDEFTYDTIVDRKTGVNKNEFITKNTKQNEYDIKISETEYKEVKEKFLKWMNNILSNSTWLKKYIVEKFYLSIDGYDTFRFDFRKGEIKLDNVQKKGLYYIMKIPSRVFYELITEEILDWEEAFLSCRCKFERGVDKYNPWIVGFFRNLDIDRLNKINESLNSDVTENEMLQIGEYKVQRYCPHQKYDLKYHGVVNEDEKTITCLGHGWEWKLNSGEGVNTRCKLKCFKKNRTV